MVESMYIGKRLSIKGELCTVRYVGQIPGTKGDWIGVEWDDPSKGKHSGEHDGIKYFECIKHQTTGSFIRPNRPTEDSRSFIEALRKKYASEPVDHVSFVKGEKVQHVEKPSKPIFISGKEVEEVGFDKIRRQLADLQGLRIVILDGLCITRPESRSFRQSISRLGSKSETGDAVSPSDVKDVCPKVTELDLSRNLFEEWREVLTICEQLGNLRNLRVDGTRFRDISLSDEESQHFTSIFTKMRNLSLDDNLLSWQEITTLADTFSNLQSLSASNNTFNRLEDGILPENLTSLTLENNNFRSLDDISPLKSCKKLQKLILKNNDISETTTTGNTSSFPPTLTDIDLSYNAIETWSFIDSLQEVFPGLTSLKIAHNPLFISLHSADGKALSAEDGYMLTIARLAQLKALNHSAISAKERLNSETYYLSLIATELASEPESNAPSILARHRRYKELCEEYGEVNVTRSTSTINPNSLQARLVTLHFHCSSSLAEKLSSEGKYVEGMYTQEIPKAYPVYAVLGIVGKRLGMQPMGLRLVWETGEWDPVREDKREVDEYWDTESEGDGEGEGAQGKEEKRVFREVEIVAGTRHIGMWFDGNEANVRVEAK
ncbi:tubulin-specific chaperone-like protein E, partial [Patellaria atrata CBS 101060]